MTIRLGIATTATCGVAHPNKLAQACERYERAMHIYLDGRAQTPTQISEADVTSQWHIVRRRVR